MSLIHLIYTSVANPSTLSMTEVQSILASSRRNNKKLDICGMLLFHEGSFFQILEGEKPVLDKLYEKIARDPRHANLRKLIEEPIEERAFGEWSIGHADVSADRISSIPGLNDFFTSGKSYNDLGQGRAKTLLQAFRKGQWHSQLS